MRLGKERIAPVGAGRREDVDQRRLNSVRIWFSARRTVAVEATIFGRIFLPVALPTAQLVQGRLVQADHRSQRTGDQVQFVLDDQVGRQQPSAGQRVAPAGLARAIEAVLVVPLDAAEERPDLAGPGHGRELVHRGDQEARQPAIDRLIDRQDRQRLAAAEVAMAVDAVDAQVGRDGRGWASARRSWR